MGVTSLERRPRRRVGRRLLVPGALALALATALVWQASYASFGDSAPAFSASVGTGTLTLVDDDSAVRMFTATGLKPGSTGSKCITVSSSGSPATVKLYGTGRNSTKELASYLDITVHLGSGGSTRSCSGFTAASTAFSGTLANFPTGGWASGVGGWTTTGAAATNRVYQIVYTLRAGAPYSTQNGTASLCYVWESRTAS